MTDSNRRHPACKAGALPTELIARAPTRRCAAASVHIAACPPKARARQSKSPGRCRGFACLDWATLSSARRPRPARSGSSGRGGRCCRARARPTSTVESTTVVKPPCGTGEDGGVANGHPSERCRDRCRGIGLDGPALPERALDATADGPADAGQSSRHGTAAG